MKDIALPLICPKCKSTDVEEVAESVTTRDFYAWDKVQSRYLFETDDNENYGDVYIVCGSCGYRYSDEEYEAFAMSNPVYQR
jgi:hypothetical protein